MDAEDECTAYFATAEDIVLAKLEWYHHGDQVSDRQWRDVVGVIRTQGQRLDLTYLGAWAAQLGLEDLLSRALSQAGE